MTRDPDPQQRRTGQSETDRHQHEMPDPQPDVRQVKSPPQQRRHHNHLCNAPAQELHPAAGQPMVGSATALVPSVNSAVTNEIAALVLVLPFANR